MAIPFLLCHCSTSGDGGQTAEESLVDPTVGYQSWPNSTTSEPNVNYITSKILVSDLDQDGNFENIFISELRFSSNKKSSVLRITSTSDFTEVGNFKSLSLHLYKESHPFAYDLNGDGDKELIFVSYDLDEIYAIEFKEKNLKNLFVRWRLKLPEPLKEDFDRNFKKISTKDGEMITIGDYAFIEKENRKPELIVTKKEKVENDDKEKEEKEEKEKEEKEKLEKEENNNGNGKN